MKKPNVLSRFARISALLILVFCLLAVIVWNPFSSAPELEEAPTPNASARSRLVVGEEDPSATASLESGNAEAGSSDSQAQDAVRDGGRIAKNQTISHKQNSPSTPVPVDFFRRILSPDEKWVTIPLPGGGTAEGQVTLVQRDEDGMLLVQGNVSSPESGKFMFQRQTEPGVAGPFVGHIHYDKSDVAYQIRPIGKDGAPVLVKVSVDEVICRALPAFVGVQDAPAEAPQTHPKDYPIPPDENGVIQLQSLPGATAVVYLDFDGEEENFLSWGYINALPSGRTASQIFDVWRGIAEDYQPFKINITTIRSVYEAAPQGRRMHVIFTPTTDAAPGSGGVAYVGSFNQTGHRVCWVFYSSGKNAVEAGSHEIGHTLGLSHDGRISPAEDYYKGHNGWAPIMGVGYYQPLSQWSKGEYASANQTQDDLKIISSNNNSVAYRTDDFGGSYANSAWLDIDSEGVVSNEGVIETTGDQDGLRFTTHGGLVSLSIKNVSFNPNLDVSAEILTSAGVVVSSSNSEASTTASFTALNLTAGHYFLRVSGAGKGAADLTTGYTNYGSLGAYLITGTIAGGESADHFNVAENAASGSPVGISVPRVDHGAGVPAFGISSGNVGGAFSINSSTGQITVVNQSGLDFESLSTRWDDPASFELFVSVTDNLGVAAESIRTVVTIEDVNEAPILTAFAPQTLPENISVGYAVATASAVDPDRSDHVSYSISSGNVGNAFEINPVTGVISVAGNLDFENTASYTLMVRATDFGTTAIEVDSPLVITILNTIEGLIPGSMVRAFYKNITGTNVSALTSNSKFPGSPDSFETLTSFDGRTNLDDNFGSAMCGFLIAPITGNYTFWIAANDTAELRLSPGSNPADAVVRATVGTSTTPHNWTYRTSQKSSTMALIAGQAYYIEVRHKEGSGDDHVAVAWQGPGMSVKEVIPGRWLAPYPTNYAPVIDSASFSVRENTSPGRAIGIVTSQDPNATDRIGSFTITGGNADGAFNIDSATGQLTVADPEVLDAVSTPLRSLTIQVTDSGTPPYTSAGSVTVRVVPADDINVSGLVQEIWTGLSSSTAILSLTESANFPNHPNQRRTLTSFDSGGDIGDNYGSRIRARFVPPNSGVYQFYISSDEDSRLLFSEDPSGAGAAEIGSVTGACNPNEWTKFPSQKSANLTLVAGQAVYLETLHKEANGSDHVSVGYSGPGSGSVTVIPESLLQPFDINPPPDFSSLTYRYVISVSAVTSNQFLGAVSATDPDEESLVYSIVSGNGGGAFSIDPATGSISIIHPEALVPGMVQLQVMAQDAGLQGAYPLANAITVVEIQLEGDNSPPTFIGDSLSQPTAFADVPYDESIADSATDSDAGDTLHYSKISGPSWLVIGSSGELSGMPSDEDQGVNSFVVRVSDSHGALDEATLVINVPGIAIWANSAGGTWQAAGNWQDGVIAGGTGSTADFSKLDLNDDVWVMLDGPCIVGNLVFGDLSSGNDWILSSGTTGPLTLNVTKGVPAITVNNPLAILDLVLAGSKGLVKEGSGTLVLAGSNTYTGPTTITDGEICINGSIASSLVRVGTNAILSGDGSVFGTILVSGRLSPGDGVGELATGAATLEESATLSWQAADWTGEAGVGYDKLMAKSLNLAGASSIHLKLDEQNLVNFLDTAKTFTLVETAEGISGFSAEKFIIDATDFPTATGTWVVRMSGNALLLDYTPLNSAPTFTVSPIDGGSVSVGEPFSMSITSLATDADPGDSLIYAKVSGPDWLQVASNGDLSGIPPVTNLGSNEFVVEVIDAGFLSDMTSMVIDVTGTPWQVWQLASFGGQAVTPQTAGELDDPDHDGIANLLEFALGLDPNLAGDTMSVLTHDVETIDGKKYLRLNVSRSLIATDVLLEVEVSGDMIMWGTDQTVIETDTGSTLRARDTVPLDSEECRFIRLKAVSSASNH